MRKGLPFTAPSVLRWRPLVRGQATSRCTLRWTSRIVLIDTIGRHLTSSWWRLAVLLRRRTSVRSRCLRSCWGSERLLTRILMTRTCV